MSFKVVLLRNAVAAAVFVLLTAGLTRRVESWPRYNDGCQACHGHFLTDPYVPAGGGPAWPASLHTVHNDPLYMGTECALCHRTGDGDNPYTKFSDGVGSAPPIGCSGCHTRPYDNYPMAVALTAVHDRAGAGCGTCHIQAGYPPAHPEFVQPPYYGLPYTNVDSSCNGDASTLEDYSGDGVGLDNDGDGLVDMADPNCGVPDCGNDNVEAGETCDGSDLSGHDCTTVSIAFGGGVLSCLADCSGFVTDGCTPAPVCGNGIIEGIEVCDGTALDGQDCETIGQGFFGGDLACGTNCRSYDTSGCYDPPTCGNGITEPGETCDPVFMCPATCDDDDPCTDDVMHGSTATCDVSCENIPIPDCDPGAENGSGCNCRLYGNAPVQAGLWGMLLLVLLGLAVVVGRRP